MTISNLFMVSFGLDSMPSRNRKTERRQRNTQTSLTHKRQITIPGLFECFTGNSKRVRFRRFILCLYHCYYDYYYYCKINKNQLT